MEELKIEDEKEEEEEFDLDNFGFEGNENLKYMEGECFLKTKGDNFKSHWAALVGNELYFFRRK